MEKTQNFTEGKILSPLIRFTIPILLAILLQALYGAVDLLVVGQFGNSASIAAVSTGSQIMQTITGIVSGLTMGLTVILGQRIGEGRLEEAAKTVGGAVALFATIGVVLTAVMLIEVRRFAALMNAPEEAFEGTVEYVMICSSGILFIIAYNVISGMFRGLGNSKLPLIFVGIACVTNIAGDLILVGIFGLDAAGAAIATVFAQAVSVISSLVIIKKGGISGAYTFLVFYE